MAKIGDLGGPAMPDGTIQLLSHDVALASSALTTGLDTFWENGADRCLSRAKIDSPENANGTDLLNRG